MTHSKWGFGLAVAAAAFMVQVSTADVAEAGRSPEKVFRGKIITAKKRLPLSAKSTGAYIKKLRSAKKTKFWENKTKKSWKIYYGAFFKRPLNDLEVTVNLYDITDGKRFLKGSFEQYLDSRGQKSIISNITIEREHFGVNRHIMMTVETRGKVLATGKFMILGEGPKYTGEVNFTEEETRGK
jgi:hypothetical protein